MRLSDMKIVLAAALAACGAPAKKPAVVGNSGSGSGSGSGSVKTVLPAACKHGEPNVTSCGGADVAIEDLAACGFPTETAAHLSEAQCHEVCGTFPSDDCVVSENSQGSPAVFCEASQPCMGRLASDGELTGGGYCDEVIDHLARAYRMEARSVDAFEELAADLARWGAPEELVAACRDAARDEARHAELMAGLLAARGVVVAAEEQGAAPGFPSLRALAVHNEREGVAGESVGALAALVQAELADDEDVRVALRAIADDEAAHAVLSLAISAWVRTQPGIDPAELDAARRAGFVRLEAPQAPAAIGWPAPEAIAVVSASLAPATT